jgi:hypothetical protein
MNEAVFIIASLHMFTWVVVQPKQYSAKEETTVIRVLLYMSNHMHVYGNVGAAYFVCHNVNLQEFVVTMFDVIPMELQAGIEKVLQLGITG